VSHRTIAIFALLVVFGLALASTGCVARAQTPSWIVTTECTPAKCPEWPGLLSGPISDRDISVRLIEPGIKCDGYDRISGTLHYSCANIDYDKLAEIAPIFAGRGKRVQVWVRSADPQVDRFTVRASWVGLGDHVIVKALTLLRNGSQQTIFEFATDGNPLQGVRIEEIHTVSSTDWMP